MAASYQITIAERLLETWERSGHTAVFVRVDRRVVPGDVDGPEPEDATESYLIGSEGAREALVRSMKEGWGY